MQFCLARWLTTEQRRLVTEACTDASALYVTLACDEALKWRSYTEHEKMDLKPTATEMIQELFQK